ncbi:MAG: hypothetical protein QNJ97_17765 [Myxococcota bacterium]|nr:hypothetical protein [Myxococcota bacterium]
MMHNAPEVPEFPGKELDEWLTTEPEPFTDTPRYVGPPPPPLRHWPRLDKPEDDINF